MASTKSVLDELTETIGKAFEEVRQAMVPAMGSKRLIFSWYTSLPGLYESACRAAGGIPRAETADGLSEIATSYVDALQSRVEAELKNIVMAQDAAVRHDVKEPDADRVQELLDKASGDLQRIVDQQAQRARQMGSTDGIAQIASKLGDDDPTIFFVVVRDGALCEECKRLHLLPDERTPRVWKIGELTGDYHVRGNDHPSLQGLHPHCRCTLTYLAKGFGFNAGGRVTWISADHDEFKAQRGEAA